MSNLTLTREQQHYYGAVQRLAMLLGRKYGVNVVFGSAPRTDGTTIYLPHWNIEDPALKNALLGVIVHEAAGHVAQTDFTSWNNWFQCMARKPERMILQSIANICEDVRTEMHIMKSYPGARFFLDSALSVVFFASPYEPSDCYWSSAVNWMLHRFRSRLLGQHIIQSLADKSDEHLRKMVPAHVLVSADMLSEKIRTMSDRKHETMDILELAEGLYRLFSDAAPSKAPPKTPPAQQPQADGQGEQGGDGASEDGGGGAGSDTGDAPCSSGSPDGSSSTGESAGSATDGSAPNCGSQPSGSNGSGAQDGSSGSSGQASGSELEDREEGGSGQPASAQQSTGSGTGPAGDSEQDDQGFAPIACSEKPLDHLIGDVFRDLKELGASHAQLPMPVVTGGASAGSGRGGSGRFNAGAMLSDAASLRGSLTAALAPLLSGEVRQDVRRPNGRSLDTRRLVLTKTRSLPRVFGRKERIDDTSAVVHLLIDRSGSTSGSVYEEITKAALGLTVALEAYPEVETVISHFPSVDARSDGGIIIAKAPHESARDASKVWPVSEGGTPLDAAYKGAALTFLASQKERRILIVITDGDPDDASAARAARGFVSRLGIEIYGIVVSSKSYPLDLFDDSEKVHLASEVPAAISRLVLRVL
jgi:hypothetical protein